jgi:hypothetical protein
MEAARRCTAGQTCAGGLNGTHAASREPAHSGPSSGRHVTQDANDCDEPVAASCFRNSDGARFRSPAPHFYRLLCKVIRGDADKRHLFELFRCGNQRYCRYHCREIEAICALAGGLPGRQCARRQSFIPPSLEFCRGLNSSGRSSAPPRGSCGVPQLPHVPHPSPQFPVAWLGRNQRPKARTALPSPDCCSLAAAVACHRVVNCGASLRNV